MWKNKLLKMSMVMALSFTGLSACTMNADLEDEPNIRPEHRVVLSPRVMNLPLSVDKHGRITPADRSKLRDFAASYFKKGAQEILIANRQNTAKQVNAVKSFLKRQGIRGIELKTEPVQGQTKSGKTIELTYRYYIVRPASCGRFMQHPEFNPRNLTDLNLGCSVKNNIARMISNPSDIRSATTETHQDARPSARRAAGYLQ